MKNWAILFILMAGLLPAATTSARSMAAEEAIAARNADMVPMPRLLYPTKETVDMTGKEMLEFRWSPHEGDRLKRRSYDFRLYRGRDMLESSLVLKKFVSPDMFSLKLKNDLFKDGQVYTWSLRQIYYDSQKSRKASQSFKIINRVPEQAPTGDKEEEEKKKRSHVSRYINVPR